MKNYHSIIKKARKYLNANRIIAIPTETVYGLAGNAYSDIAVKKIFTLKKRPKNNPLIVHYGKFKKLKEDCYINKNFKKLYKKFCPGPITFILKKKKDSKISKYVGSYKNTLAVRFPKKKITRKLLFQLDYPLAAPSANMSTSLSPVTASDVKEEFGKKIKFIIDGGKSSIGLESTIVDLTNKPKILRYGGITSKDLKKILKVKIKTKLKTKKIISPGQSKFHYSPGIPVRTNAKDIKKNEAFIKLFQTKKRKENYFYLSKKGNLKEAASKLYSTLRKIKNKGYKSIAVEKIPKKGFGIAINDRLERASYK